MRFCSRQAHFDLNFCIADTKIALPCNERTVCKSIVEMLENYRLKVDNTRLMWRDRNSMSERVSHMLLTIILATTEQVLNEK